MTNNTNSFVVDEINKMLEKSKDAEKDMYQYTLWKAKKEDLEKQLKNIKCNTLVSIDVTTSGNDVGFIIDDELREQTSAKLQSIVEEHIELAETKIKEYELKLADYLK